MIRRAFLSLLWLLVSPAAFAQIGDLSGASAKPDFATNSLTLGELAGDFVRATFFGAKFDAVSNIGGVVAAGSTDFHNSAVTFTAADIGKAIILYGAGADGDPLRTTITAVSGTHATLATTATSAMIKAGATVLVPVNAGTGYQPYDIVPLSGGTATSQAQAFVASTKVVTATVNAGGSGGTTGACTLTGTTGNTNGTSTVFQATGTVAAGAIGGALTVTVAGQYRDNPDSIAAEPVTGCGLTGATVTLTMGINDLLILHPGSYTTAPSNPVSQGTAIMGSGTGATFTLTTGNQQSWVYGTDSGPAIQAAIDYCESKVVSYAQGCTVWLPPGQTITSQALTINKQEVSLASLSHSNGFAQRNVTGSTQQSFPTRLLYGGATNPGHMLTVAPLLADAHRLIGNDVTGILFDCDGEFGCAGVFLQSVVFGEYKAGVSEPQPRAYTTTGAVAAGSNTVVLTDATGVTLGQTFLSPQFLSGTYVAAISSNTLTLSTQAYGSGVASGRRVLFGGEGWRLDVASGLGVVNDTQNNDLSITSRNLNSVSPCIIIGGSSAAGSAQYGNTSINKFWNTGCYYAHGDALVLNNSDHNLFYMEQFTPVPNSLGVGAGIVSNGSLDANNGSARYNWFHMGGGQRGNIFRGTSFGGYTTASFSNVMAWHVSSGGGFVSVDTAGAASLCVSDDLHPAIGCLGTQALTAHYGVTGSISHGNTRGNNAVDLQTSRTAATQVASGTTATVLGGAGNTATGTAATATGNANLASGNYSFVTGNSNTASGPGSMAAGTIATASGQNSTAIGNTVIASGTSSVALGQSSTASGTASLATGLAAVSDLYGERCHGSNAIASGKNAIICDQVLKGISGADTTQIRLTADNLTAGALNCVNITSAPKVYNLRVQLAAIDQTTATNNYAWTQPMGLLARSGNASTVTYAGGTPTTLANGTTTGLAIAEAADTTNGCYDLRFTPPNGNTHVWHVSAVVTWERTD